MRALAIAILVGLSFTQAASAQSADCRFRWQPGQVLNYRVEHLTSIVEVFPGEKGAAGSRIEVKSKGNLLKRWQVTAVDGQGVATVQMSIVAMRQEHTRPGGE